MIVMRENQSFDHYFGALPHTADPVFTSPLQAIIADPGTVTLGPWFLGRSQ
jgi:phospholipase C